MSVDGVAFLEKFCSRDLRGSSMKIFDKNKEDEFVTNEIFISNSKKDVIRGMHFQPYPYGQEKIISVLVGEIEGVIIDLRKQSNTYKEIQVVELDEESKYSVFVPKYCAWGFKAIAENNTLIYNISGEYNREADLGIHWNSINYDWKIENPVLSDRDNNLMSLEEYIRRNHDGKDEM